MALLLVVLVVGITQVFFLRRSTLFFYFFLFCLAPNEPWIANGLNPFSQRPKPISTIFSPPAKRQPALTLNKRPSSWFTLSSDLEMQS